MEYIWAYWKQHELAQRLPEGLLGTRRARPQSAAANAPQTALDYRFLEIRLLFVSIDSTLANTVRATPKGSLYFVENNI